MVTNPSSCVLNRGQLMLPGTAGMTGGNLGAAPPASSLCHTSPRNTAAEGTRLSEYYTILYPSFIFYLDHIFTSVAIVLHNLDPVVVGVQQERHLLHAAICESLLPIAVQILKPLACGLEVIHRDSLLVLAATAVV